MTGYNVERRLLRAHADKLYEYHDTWKRVVQQKVLSGEAHIDTKAFTSFGDDFVSAFDALVSDYTTYIAGVQQALVKGSATLNFVARNVWIGGVRSASPTKELHHPAPLGSGWNRKAAALVEVWNAQRLQSRNSPGPGHHA